MEELIRGYFGNKLTTSKIIHRSRKTIASFFYLAVHPGSLTVMKKAILFGVLIICLLPPSAVGQSTLTEIVAKEKPENFIVTDIGTSFPFETNEGYGLLLDRLADKKLILVGESAHGAANLLLFKYDLFKKLVLLNKAKCLLLEAQFNRTLKLDDFVNGRLPLDSLDACFFRMPLMYPTEEFKSLVLWMRDYNTFYQPQDRVHVYGIDVQDVEAGFDYLRNYFLKTDEKYAEKLLTYSPIKASNKALKYQLDVYSEENLAEMEQHLEAIRQNAKSGFDLETGQIAVRVLENMRMCSYVYNHLKDFKRDLYMSENVQWILNRERKDMSFVVSAHNGHVINDGGELGNYLKDIFGKEVYTIGTDFGQGQVLARLFAPDAMMPFETHDVSFLAADSISVKHLRDRVRLIQPTRADTGDSHSVMIRTIGAAYDPKRSWVYWREVNLPDSFDCIVYFDSVSAIQPLVNQRR